AVRGLTVDITPGPAATRGGKRPTTPERRRRELSSIAIDGLRIHLQRANGSVIEMAAGRGEMGWRDGDRAHLRGGVRVLGEGVDVVVPALDFDPSARRFIGAGYPPDRDAVDRINTAMGHIDAPD